MLPNHLDSLGSPPRTHRGGMQTTVATALPTSLIADRTSAAWTAAVIQSSIKTSG